MLIEKPRFGPEQYPASSVIIRQGDLPEKFYIIFSGYADVEHLGPEGLNIIDHLGPGDFFGEIGLLKHKRRNATIRAKSDVKVMSMDQQTFANWLNTSGLVQEEIEELVDVREKRVERWGGGDTERLAAEILPRPLAVSSEETAVIPNTPSRKTQGPLQFNAGDVIVHQGAPANRFYVIIEGEVEVVQRDDDGKETAIGRLNDGQYFGEIGLLEGSKRTATICAVTDVKVIPFTREQFRTWLAKSPDSKDEIEEMAHTRLLRDTGSLQPPEGV
jgi:CRP-like cAMP-binding protein